MSFHCRCKWSHNTAPQLPHSVQEPPSAPLPPRYTLASAPQLRSLSSPVHATCPCFTHAHAAPPRLQSLPAAPARLLVWTWSRPSPPLPASSHPGLTWPAWQCLVLPGAVLRAPGHQPPPQKCAPAHTCTHRQKQLVPGESNHKCVWASWLRTAVSCRPDVVLLDVQLQ